MPLQSHRNTLPDAAAYCTSLPHLPYLSYLTAPSPSQTQTQLKAWTITTTCARTTVCLNAAAWGEDARFRRAGSRNRRVGGNRLIGVEKDWGKGGVIKEVGVV